MSLYHIYKFTKIGLSQIKHTTNLPQIRDCILKDPAQMHTFSLSYSPNKPLPTYTAISFPHKSQP